MATKNSVVSTFYSLAISYNSLSSAITIYTSENPYGNMVTTSGFHSMLSSSFVSRCIKLKTLNMLIYSADYVSTHPRPTTSSYLRHVSVHCSLTQSLCPVIIRRNALCQAINDQKLHLASETTGRLITYCIADVLEVFQCRKLDLSKREQKMRWETAYCPCCQVLF
jgi:hypothetical protein